MSRLHIEAAAAPFLAAPGNQGMVDIVASITGHDAEPATGLRRERFTCPDLIHPPGGSAVVVDAVHEATAGVYVVQVLPLEDWTDGTYLFVLTVETRHDRGQTIVPLVIPPL